MEHQIVSTPSETRAMREPAQDRGACAAPRDSARVSDDRIREMLGWRLLQPSTSRVR